MDTGKAAPEAWTNLIIALAILSKHPSNDDNPFNCTHDTLRVMADDTAFTPGEIDQLDKLGFHVDENNGGFYSFRYGSA